MNRLSELNALLNKKITLYAPASMDDFKKDVEAIKYTYDPSRAKITKYIDGSSISEQVFSYYCRSANADKAREQCDAIGEALDLCRFEMSKGLFISCLENTETVYVGKTDVGAFTYMKTLKIEFEKE